MSFIKLPAAEELAPELQPTYQQIEGEFGFLPRYFRAIGRDPSTVVEQIALYNKIVSGTLSKALKEEVGLVVSGINSSSYCVAAHMELLRRLGVEKKLGRKLATNYLAAPVGDKEKALYRFADKLTRAPQDLNEADAQELYAAGWDENALYETVLAVSYFNYINRISIGLGLIADL